jgi:indolepyruvate ferredoxin oxidoreductase beta subunit
MLVSQGYVITIGETYGASQRGGAVMSHLRISTKDQFSPLIPEGQCDLLVSLEPVEGLRILDTYGNPRVMTLLNIRPIQPIDVISGNATYPEVSKVISKIKELSRRVWTLNATDRLRWAIHLSNIVMLGALCHRCLAHRCQGRIDHPGSLPSRLQEILKAFDKGREVVQEPRWWLGRILR